MAPLTSAFPECRVVPNEDPERHSALVMRNVSVRGRRTSIRLEPQIWDTIAEICRREFCTPHDVCSYAAERRPPYGSLASSLRVVILDYFRTASTEDGHRIAGHGQGMFMAQQQERLERRKLQAHRREPDGAERREPHGADRQEPGGLERGLGRARAEPS